MAGKVLNPFDGRNKVSLEGLRRAIATMAADGGERRGEGGEGRGKEGMTRKERPSSRLKFCRGAAAADDSKLLIGGKF